MPTTSSPQSRMRLAPLTGVLAVVLWVIGVAVLDSGDAPDDGASGEVLAQQFRDNDGSILAGAFIVMVGTAVFVWFLNLVRQRIHWAEGVDGRFAPLLFGAGILTAAMVMAFMAPSAAAAFTRGDVDRNLSAGAAEALSILGDGFFLAAEVSVAALFLAAGLAALWTRALPIWFGWLSILLAVVALIPWIGWAAFIWGLPLWVLIASFWMFMQPASPEQAGTGARPS